MIPDDSIIQFLAKNNATLTHENKWMIVERVNDTFEYSVFLKYHFDKKTRLLYRGESFSRAMSILEELDGVV